MVRVIFLRYFTNRLKIEGEHRIEFMGKFSLGRIAHPLRVFFLSLTALVFTVNSSLAQSEGWAAGEIVLEYVKGNCLNLSPANKVTYDVILKFYRDDYGITAPPFENTRDVMVYSPDNGITFANAFAHELTLVPNSERSVNQYCLNGNPVATQGAWYRSTNSFELFQTGTWYFYYVGQYDGDYRSPEDRNIQLGQQFFIETRFDFECGYVNGNIYDPVTQTYIPGQKYNEAPKITPTEYVFEDPVASFCVGKDYEYNFKAINGNEVSKVEFAFAPIWKGKNQLVSYLTSEGFTIKSPFPTNSAIDESDLEVRGIIRFRPSKTFAGPVPFLVKNYTNVWTVDPGDVNQELQLKEKLAVMTQREYRFIFDNNCNSRLPDFIGGEYREANPGLGDYQFFPTFNGVQNAYEYDCAGTEFVFQLTEPVLIESLGLIGVPYEQQDQGFRFASIGVGNNPNPFLDDIPVEKVENINVINVDETDLLRVTLSRRVGPGKYYLYMKKGDDLNTLVNRCESTIPEFDTLSILYVNDTYVYNHKEEQYSYCFPTGKPPVARISVANPDYVGWKYYGGTRFFPPGNPGNSPVDDTTFHDTTYLGPRTFVLDKPEDPAWSNSKINIGAGWWRVGAGFDFSTFNQQTGQIIEKRVCYGEDNFYVDTITVEDLSIPDFDLCPREDLPLIDLSAYKTQIISNSFDWGKWDGTTLKDFYSQYADPAINVPDSPGRDYLTVSTQPYIFDTKGAYTGVGDTNYFRSMFRMRGKYNPAKTCPVQLEFKVLKQLVEVELNYPADSVICEGEEYVLRNTKGDNYFIPEQYSYQWYLNQAKLQNDTTDTLLITTTGMYTLEVTKTTANSVCLEYDSVFVRVSPFLDQVVPGCAEITFKNSQIEQLFSWNTVPLAQDYQARIVLSPEFSGSSDIQYGPWETANGLYGINHRTVGPRLGLEVRAVNGGVDDDAICKYSVPAYAQPCDAIVKPTNVFTPNGDGINDFLKFDLVEIYPGSKLSVFNRWGKLIYNNNNYFNDWDGEDFKEGTYFYVLDINDPNQELMKGTFTIIRD